MAHFLITGGAGFIGSHLAERLLGAGHSVTVMDNCSTGRQANIAHLRDHPKFRLCIESIENAAVLDRLVSECDAIFHLAAAVGVKLIVERPAEVIETNVVGTASVLNVARRYKRGVFIASTSEIYGKSERIPFKEDDDRLLGPTTKSRWCYSDSKAVDEFLGLAYHKEHGLKVVIGRFLNTIGPRQTGHYGMVVPRFVQAALAGRPIEVYGDGKQSRCFLDVDEAVDADIKLMEHERAGGEVFNIGSIREITITALAEKIIALTKSASTITRIPYDQACEPGFEDMRRRVPDLSKLKQWIGMEPNIPLDQTLQRIIAYHGVAGRGA